MAVFSGRTYSVVAFVVVVAAVLCSLVITGCVTPRHMDELNGRLDRIERQNQQTQATLAHMDSLITEGEEADGRLRNELRVTVDQLESQIANLLENYNDLMQQLQVISQQKGIRIRPSPGASDTGTYQSGVSPEEQNQGPPPTMRAALDCDSTYDEFFLQLRRGEYEVSIGGFRTFIENCPEHESVENAHYWIGECYYSLEKYVDAINELEYLINNFKSSPNLSRAFYKLGRSQEELGQKEDARNTFTRLTQDFPETLEAEQAKERLKDL